VHSALEKTMPKITNPNSKKKVEKVFGEVYYDLENA
jgi:hypothetical protein